VEEYSIAAESTVVSPKETTMPKPRSTVSYVAIGVLLSGTLLGAGPGAAGLLDASWTAPTTNTDGSPLTDLAFYRLYYGPSTSPCPGSASVQVAAPTSTPGSNQTMSYRLTGLTAGTLYNVAVTAVDSIGLQSVCSSVASAVARSEFALSPTGTVNFGSVNVGGFADQVFTVSNTGGGTISGSAAVAAPFSVVSGSPFTLSGVGATKAVTVRFAPVTNTTVSANLSVIASGSTLSSTLLGTGTKTSSTADATAPSVTITSPTTSPTFTASGSTLTLSGTASDSVGVTQVTWTNSLGGSGIAAGTTTWTTGAIPLLPGSNTLTVSARDAAGNTGGAVLTVTVANISTAGPTGSDGATGPVMSKSTISVRSSSVTISWTTNKPSDTQVVYGLTTSCGSLTPSCASQTQLNSSLVMSHSQVLSGLAPRTWYHLRMRSRDAAGNLTVSGDVKFKTH
jgi:Bacterial Ig domain/Fibronectin type III domain